jgi:hypothetical protein
MRLGKIDEVMTSAVSLGAGFHAVEQKLAYFQHKQGIMVRDRGT